MKDRFNYTVINGKNQANGQSTTKNSLQLAQLCDKFSYLSPKNLQVSYLKLPISQKIKYIIADLLINIPVLPA